MRFLTLHLAKAGGGLIRVKADQVVTIQESPNGTLLRLAVAEEGKLVRILVSEPTEEVVRQLQ
ncbi:hypothetical protein [Propylenella binzhouense]|uniref:Uncharacterized protein n=1 Tax=Propylenella binzhouense TaxID=2555902 RepID=A0A964T3B1_9HYPH|nr:hypothetical protein [Propylenella binzhouense]MYZ47144.1 hypothetical protein [Propylenella binzhouense]